MANHPNRGKVTRIRGAVMTAGYRDGDGGVTRVRIRADGRVVEHDPDMHALAQDEADNSPLVLDEDGLLTRTGAAAGASAIERARNPHRPAFFLLTTQP